MNTPSDIPVAVRSTIRLPFGAAAPVFAAVAHELDKRSESLNLDLGGDLQMPIEASVHVSVTPHVADTKDPHRFDIRLAAEAAHDYYPHFRGSLVLEPDQRYTCVLVIEGHYAVPFGDIGKNIDMTFLRGAAAKSLQRFVDQVADEVSRRTREQQEREVRDAQRNGG
jgi:hypothetical protein